MVVRRIQAHWNDSWKFQISNLQTCYMKIDPDMMVLHQTLKQWFKCSVAFICFWARFNFQNVGQTGNFWILLLIEPLLMWSSFLRSLCNFSHKQWAIILSNRPKTYIVQIQWLAGRCCQTFLIQANLILELEARV